MRLRGVCAVLAAVIGITSAAARGAEATNVWESAKARMDDLRISTYMTASSVRRLAREASSRERAVGVLRGLGVTKVYLEVYRSGVVVPRAELEQIRDFLETKGFATAGGIATTPGKGFGVRADAGLEWFNFQNEKTQRDLESVIRTSAPVFTELIVDDFLCSGDTSAESDAARRGRSWSEYRRDLLTALSRKVFIGPAKEANPAITMIIKYPQWYDRFHVYGYDVERESQLFDKVWVGTETRGAETQRFGFVQPYEGFVNYRWLAAVAGAKIGGAWFDHLDCEGPDFVDQAWQSVLAGAPELILFNYADLAAGHPGHDLLRADFEALADLAREIRQHPVTGPVGYKPPHSDAGSDLYLMDYVGMFGVPLVPSPVFPEAAQVVFLPTQAAADPGIGAKARRVLDAGGTLVLTTGFLATAADREAWCRLAGIAGPVEHAPIKARQIRVDGKPADIEPALFLETLLRVDGARPVLEALSDDDKSVPFLTEHSVGPGRVAVLNVHTFSQEDFDAVGEVLLAPRRLGLMALPREWAAGIRRAFSADPEVVLDAPARVAFQPVGDNGWIIQNYTNKDAAIQLRFTKSPDIALVNARTGDPLEVQDGLCSTTLPARSRVWLQRK